MFKMLTRFKLACYVLVVLFALCLPGSALAASPVLDRIVEKGVLRVAMSTTQPPYNIRGRDKTVIGFDVDLAQALADAMSVQLEIVEIPFGNLLDTLADDKVDMVIWACRSRRPTKPTSSMKTISCRAFARWCCCSTVCKAL